MCMHNGICHASIICYNINPQGSSDKFASPLSSPLPSVYPHIHLHIRKHTCSCSSHPHITTLPTSHTPTFPYFPHPHILTSSHPTFPISHTSHISTLPCASLPQVQGVQQYPIPVSHKRPHGQTLLWWAPLPPIHRGHHGLPSPSCTLPGEEGRGCGRPWGAEWGCWCHGPGNTARGEGRTGGVVLFSWTCDLI